MKINEKPIILVDGTAFLFRAFYSLPPLTNSKGVRTEAIYGTLNMIQKIIKDYTPNKLLVVFDHKGKTFRSEISPSYKATRPKIDKNLEMQIDPLIEIIKHSGIPLIVQEGVEADDVIGTLATQATKSKKYTLIVSSDKDMAQLVSDFVFLLEPIKNRILDAEAVKEKFGVFPDKIIEYMSLVGDSVDNIKGVEGVGPKTAAKWINQYKSLNALLEHSAEIKGKVGEKLCTSKEAVMLAKKLVTIKTDCNLEHSIDSLDATIGNTNKLAELFSEYEFKGWAKKALAGENLFALNETEPQIANKEPSTQTKYITITKVEEWHNLLEKIYKSKQFAIYLEASSHNIFEAKVKSLAFSTKANESYNLPFHSEGRDLIIKFETILKDLEALVGDPEMKMIGHDLKFLQHVFSNYGIEVNCKFYDIMIESYVFNSLASHKLDDLVVSILKKNLTKVSNKSDTNSNDATLHLNQSVDYIFQIHEWFEQNSTEKFNEVNLNIEQPLIKVLSYMERAGVKVSKDLLDEQGKALNIAIQDYRKQIISEVGEDFNLNSPKQLRHILFEKMNLPVLHKTPKGQPSTAESTLSEMADKGFEIPSLILKFRSLFKLKTTYVDSLPSYINNITHRIHTTYQQTTASTGRLSSMNPNLQNIPIKNAEGRKIRKAFVPAEGKILIAADYSQIELRIMAHFSEDPSLVDAFNKNLDIHQATAAQIFNVELEKVTSEHRRTAKAVNFGLIYGMQAFGLSQQLKINVNDAKVYIDNYFKKYPNVIKFMDQTKQKAKKTGFVETLFGRKLLLTDINSSNRHLREYAERAAINAPMQGTAADIIKIAMINIHKFIKDKQKHISMIMQVHDELVFEVDKDSDLEKIKKEISDIMTTAWELKVPLLVESKVGINWDEAH